MRASLPELIDDQGHTQAQRLPHFHAGRGRSRGDRRRWRRGARQGAPARPVERQAAHRRCRSGACPASNGSRPNGAEHVAPPMRPPIWTARRWFSPPRATRRLDRRISEDARAAGIPVNAVDRPELCDFFTPALVNRAPLAVAIGTEGAGPVLAQIVRAKIDRLLSPSLGPLAVLANSLPRGRRAAAAEGERAPPLLERVLHRRAVARHGSRRRSAGARRAASELLSRSAAAQGHIALVGAGSGRGGSSDAAGAQAADGSRRDRLRRAGARGSRRHGPPRRGTTAGRQAQGLPHQEPGRDQRPAG